MVKMIYKIKDCLWWGEVMTRRRDVKSHQWKTVHLEGVYWGYLALVACHLQMLSAKEIGGSKHPSKRNNKKGTNSVNCCMSWNSTSFFSPFFFSYFPQLFNHKLLLLAACCCSSSRTAGKGSLFFPPLYLLYHLV